jgi:hypothetical protein
MKISEFARMRVKYEEKARARAPERIDHGSMDTLWGLQVIEEMLIDMFEQRDKDKQEFEAFRDEVRGVLFPEPVAEPPTYPTLTSVEQPK